MHPDYSRQQLLKEIGAAGQATLERSRVLIATDPALVLRLLAEAFDALASFRHLEVLVA